MRGGYSWRMALFVLALGACGDSGSPNDSSTNPIGGSGSGGATPSTAGGSGSAGTHDGIRSLGCGRSESGLRRRQRGSALAPAQLPLLAWAA